MSAPLTDLPPFWRRLLFKVKGVKICKKNNLQFWVNCGGTNRRPNRCTDKCNPASTGPLMNPNRTPRTRPVWPTSELKIMNMHFQTIWTSHPTMILFKVGLTSLTHYGAIAAPLIRTRWTSGRVTNLDINGRLD